MSTGSELELIAKLKVQEDEMARLNKALEQKQSENDLLKQQLGEYEILSARCVAYENVLEVAKAFLKSKNDRNRLF